MSGPCEWCGIELAPGSGEWGRPQSGRYGHRPGRFCGQKCYDRWRQLEAGKLKPEQAALRRLQLRHRDEFNELHAAELARREKMTA